MTGDRPPRNDSYRGAASAAAPRAEVNGNSVEYWEKREREAKAKAAAARGGYGDRGNSARPGQPRSYGTENRGGGNRVGVRGRFKD